MTNKHVVNFAAQNIHTDIVFEPRNHLKSVPIYMKNGGNMAVGMQVFCERGMRAALIPGTVLSWEMKEVKYDLTKLGKYGECIAHVKNNATGEILPWPFTMLYLNDGPQ